MSRVGKMPIQIPSGVKVEYHHPEVTVAGKKSTLRRTLNHLVSLEIDGQTIKVIPVDDSKEARAMWGLTRTLVANMVQGVSSGFTRVLEIIGTGYRAELQGGTLNMSLGFSHPVVFPLPDGVSGEVDRQNRITLTSADKELLGLTAAKIRAFRKPEPYKGKGVKYSDEVVLRKVGKAGARDK